MFVGQMNVQEEECADELASHGDEVVPRAIGNPLEERMSSWALHLFVFAVRCYSSTILCCSDFASSVTKEARKKTGPGTDIIHGGRLLPLLSLLHS